VAEGSAGPASSFDRWSLYYAREQGLSWPSETLVRLFRGRYVPSHDPASLAGRSVLDVGFGKGQNLAFLGTLSLALAGTEVRPDMCDLARQRLESLGFAADLRVGTNRDLPFGDGAFDFVVSWNVLHYENEEEAVRAALCEYQRVLKPGGRLFLSTTGPEDAILRGSSPLGSHRHRLGHGGAFRSGDVHYCFESTEHLAALVGEWFADVHVGRTRNELFSAIADSLIATGTRGPRALPDEER
jgi:SAM-dependent methyltransferase